MLLVNILKLFIILHDNVLGVMSKITFTNGHRKLKQINTNISRECEFWLMHILVLDERTFLFFLVLCDV